MYVTYETNTGRAYAFTEAGLPYAPGLTTRPLSVEEIARMNDGVAWDAETQTFPAPPQDPLAVLLSALADAQTMDEVRAAAAAAAAQGGL